MAEVTSAVGPVALVVPVFNEEERLREHGERLLGFVATFGQGSELIIVDDGSTDGTCEVAEGLVRKHPSGRVSLVRRPHEGKGAAVRAGLEDATAGVAGFCDVDLATPLDQLQRLFAAAFAAPALVIGSRGVVSSVLVRREGHVRELLGKTYNRLLRITLTPGICDTQCGAKAATTAVWREILPHCRERGFAWDVEAVAVARRLDIAVWELGILWAHDPRTRVRPLVDGMAMVWAVPRIWKRTHAVSSLLAREHQDGLVARRVDSLPTRSGSPHG